MGQIKVCVNNLSFYFWGQFFKHVFLKASEILLFNRKLNAQEAYERNLINEIIPVKDFSKIVWEKIERISKLSPKVNIYSRIF